MAGRHPADSSAASQLSLLSELLQPRDRQPSQPTARRARQGVDSVFENIQIFYRILMNPAHFDRAELLAYQGQHGSEHSAGN